MSEFFSEISFDAYGQNEMTNLVQQLFPSRTNFSQTAETLVFTDGSLVGRTGHRRFIRAHQRGKAL